jgi:hypothetical protein
LFGHPNIYVSTGIDSGVYCALLIYQKFVFWICVVFVAACLVISTACYSQGLIFASRVLLAGGYFRHVIIPFAHKRRAGGRESNQPERMIAGGDGDDLRGAGGGRWCVEVCSDVCKVKPNMLCGHCSSHPRWPAPEFCSTKHPKQVQQPEIPLCAWPPKPTLPKLTILLFGAD